MSQKLMFSACLVSTVLVALVGCAGLKYKKVPTPTQYTEWTDQMQAKADNMEGVRYYLPRPFVHVKKSFPVAQRVAIVSFNYVPSTNAKPAHYAMSTPESTPAWVRRSVPTEISITTALAAQLYQTKSESGSQKSIGGQQSTGGGDGGEGQGDQPSGDQAGASVPDNAQKIPSKLVARTGFLSASDPVTELGTYMDIVYLPDFEEQYVIQARPGIGQADVETQLRNGWAAEVFGMSVDNSNLIPFMIEQIGNASEMAAEQAGTWGLNIATGGAGGTAATLLTDSTLDKLSTGLQSTANADQQTEAAKALLGGVALFKVVEVKFAQPGVYPILKPREVLYWMRGYQATNDAQGKTRSYDAPKLQSQPLVDVSAGVKYYIKQDTKEIVLGNLSVPQDPDVAMQSYFQQLGMPWVTPDIFIPAPPFTMVGFNTTTDIFVAPASQPTQIQKKQFNGGSSADAINLKEYLEDIFGMKPQLKVILVGERFQSGNWILTFAAKEDGELPDFEDEFGNIKTLLKEQFFKLNAEDPLPAGISIAKLVEGKQLIVTLTKLDKATAQRYASPEK